MPEIKPNPDPTVATNDAVGRAVRAERDYVDGALGTLSERLNGIDRATELRLAGIVAIPGQISAEVGHLESLVNEKFASVATQFLERDTRQEREARDNKVAVDAAFAAQKEAAAKQDETNLKAIDKSEKATEDKINKLAELHETTNKALGDRIEANSKAAGDKLDDMKERINSVERAISERFSATERLFLERFAAMEVRISGAEQNRQGGRDATRESRESIQSIYVAVAILGILVSIGLGIALAVKP